MSGLHDFESYLQTIHNVENREKLLVVINWIKKEFKDLSLEIKWNQPMFIKDGTHILSLSVSKEHFSVAPEFKGMEVFRDKIANAGYSQSKMLFRIKFSEEVNYQLLREIINFNIEDKKGLNTFWRKES